MEQLDLKLMQQIARGDEAAVAELYNRFGGLVFRVARQLLPTQPEAEETCKKEMCHIGVVIDPAGNIRSLQERK